MSDSRPVVVAIPVRNEAPYIRDCLQALDQQVGAQADDVVLLLSNCTDATARIAATTMMRPGTRLRIVKRQPATRHANPGHARRLAMQRAARLAGPNGILLTTDANARVQPNWLTANLAVIDAGADAVMGLVEPDPMPWSPPPRALHDTNADVRAYQSLCDEIQARLNPDPFDPWPRHTHASGASLAVTAAAFRRCGGGPDVPTGEDRALLAALRRIDARIRHAPEVQVFVSRGCPGAATEDMTDTIQRRMVKPDHYLDPLLEPALDCARRARLRQMVALAYRQSIPEPELLAGWLQLPDGFLARTLRHNFGAAWQIIERSSPVLRRRMVAVSALATEMATARGILAQSGACALDGRRDGWKGYEVPTTPPSSITSQSAEAQMATFGV